MLEFFEAVWYAQNIKHKPNLFRHILSQFGRIPPFPLSFRKGCSPDMSDGLIRLPGASSLMILDMVSIGTAYANIVIQPSGYVLRIGVALEGLSDAVEQWQK